MVLVERTISEKLTKYLKLFPIVAIVGPQQSGKTIFAKIELEKFWLTGGYPEPLLWNENDRLVWMEQYVRTFVEIDFLVHDRNGLHAYELKTSTTIDSMELNGFKRSLEQLGDIRQKPGVKKS